MKLQEYASRQLFTRYGIPTKPFYLARSPDEAEEAAQVLKLPVVIKAQVLVGGRGKAGGIKLAESPGEAREVAEEILSLTLNGIPVKKVLVAEAVNIEREFYLAIILDRGAKKPLIMLSAVGGVDIEQIAKDNPEGIKRFYIEPLIGLKPYIVRQVIHALPGDIPEVGSILLALYKLFEECGATLVEINPLALDRAGKLWAVDAKIILDDAGLYINPNLAELRDLEEETPSELEAERHGLSYVKLSGNIGCIVNGAGLAMATTDLITYFGSAPANFLDVGGSSSPDKIRNAMRILVADEDVRAILVNIFGGITRCDDIAEGLWVALKELDVKLPVVVCLRGTREDEAKAFLGARGIDVMSDMEEAIKKVCGMVGAE